MDKCEACHGLGTFEALRITVPDLRKAVDNHCQSCTLIFNAVSKLRKELPSGVRITAIHINSILRSFETSALEQSTASLALEYERSEKYGASIESFEMYRPIGEYHQFRNDR